MTCKIIAHPVSVSVPSLISNETTLCPGPPVKIVNNLNIVYQVLQVVRKLHQLGSTSVVSIQLKRLMINNEVANAMG